MNASGPQRPCLRWLGSFALVLLAHALLLAVLLWPGRTTLQHRPPPPQAVMVELAPLPRAPAVAASDLAPGPAQREALAAPATPTPTSAKPLATTPSLPLPTHAAAVLPSGQDTAPPQTAASQAAQASAPPRVEAANGAQYAAAQSSAGSQSVAFADWQARLLGHLERFKRYPRAAQRMHYQGAAAVRYRVDRHGNVLAAELAQGSGYLPLDEEAMAAVRRASPVPPPPAEIAGDPVEVTTPVQFSMHL